MFPCSRVCSEFVKKVLRVKCKFTSIYILKSIISSPCQEPYVFEHVYVSSLCVRLLCEHEHQFVTLPGCFRTERVRRLVGISPKQTKLFYL